MKTSTLARPLAALAVGAVAALTMTACTSEHTPQSYASEMRAAMPAAEQGSMNDQQIIGSGRMMCSLPGAMDSVDGNAEYAQYTEITKSYCDVLGSDPSVGALGAGAAASPAPAAPSAVAIGQRFDVLDSNGVKMADAAFTAIDVDADCSNAAAYGGSGKPERGHFVAVSMDVATTANYSSQALGYPTDFDFSLTGPDGYTESSLSASSASCVPFDETFNAPLAPSGKFRGTVLLDTKSATGTLTYKPHFSQVWPGVTVPMA